MDKKLFKSYDKELMKMEMLKHEKIFREQVYELHRLYRVQKHLMSNMEANTIRQDPDIRWISRNQQINGSNKPDHHRHHHGGSQVVADSNYNRGLGLIDESEIQLTLGPSVYKSKRPNSQQNFSSSNYSTRMENSSWNFTPLRNNGRQMNLGEEHLRQERMEKHLPWLFQPLSLKLT